MDERALLANAIGAMDEEDPQHSAEQCHADALVEVLGQFLTTESRWRTGRYVRHDPRGGPTTLDNLILV